MILMMVILSSVPFGIGTTFCQCIDNPSCTKLTHRSLLADQRGSVCCYLGLDHHVPDHFVYRSIPWRNSITVSCGWGNVLLGVYAQSGWLGPSSRMDRGMAFCCRQCDCHIDRQFRVCTSVTIKRARGNTLLRLFQYYTIDPCFNQ
jgi:hypothetical protein